MNTKCCIVFLAGLFVLSLMSPVIGGQATVDQPDQLLIKDVNVLTMTSEDAGLLENYSVLVSGQEIVAVKPKIIAPGGAKVVDAKGRYLLPGLIDMHVHIWDEAELLAYLSYGVTTVRNASGMPFHLSFKADIESGKLEGPRLFTTGPILNGPGPNTQINHQVVNNAAEARAAVRQQYAQGYRQLKVYSNLPRTAYDAVREEARRLGMPIMGHTPEGVREPGVPHKRPFLISFREVLDHPFVTIEHMESVVWHALYDQLDEVKARQLARDIAAKEAVISPTLVAHHNLVKVAETQGAYLSRPGVETLNPFVTEIEQESFAYWSSQDRNSRKDYDAFYRAAVKIFHDEGVSLVAGTDAGIFTNIPGRSLVREIELLLAAKLTPYQAIETATVNAAQALGLGSQLGQVKVGYKGDLLLLNSNPLETISTFYSPVGLLVNGRWYDTKALTELRGRAANTSYDRTQKRIQEGLAAQGTPQE